MLSNVVMTVKGAALLLFAIHLFAALLKKEDADWVKGKPRAIFLGYFITAMWCPSLWLMYLVIFLSVALLPKSRIEAAMLFAVAIVATPLFQSPISIGGLYLIASTKYLWASFGLIVCWFRFRGTNTRVRYFDIPMIILFVLELARARDPVFTETMRGVLPVLICIAIPYYFISRSLKSPEDVRRLVLALAMSGFVLAIVATAEVRLHWLMYKQLEFKFGTVGTLNPYSKQRGGVLRAPATFPESLALGNYLILAGLALLALRTSFATKQKFYIAFAILCVGLLAPNSRGAFVGFGIGVIAYDIYRRRYGSLSLKVGACAFFYLLLQLLAQFSPFFASLAGKGAGEKASADYRTILVNRGLEEIHKHPTGIDMKQALQNLSDITQGEGIVDLVNGYINYGLTLGYMGVVGLLAVFVSVCIITLAVRKRLRGQVMLTDVAAFAFSLAALSISQAYYIGFGSTGSLPFYEVCALAASLYGLSRMPLGAAVAAGGPFASVPTNQPPIWATIAAGRANAQTRSAQLRARPADRHTTQPQSS